MGTCPPPLAEYIIACKSYECKHLISLRPSATIIDDGATSVSGDEAVPFRSLGTAEVHPRVAGGAYESLSTRRGQGGKSRLEPHLAAKAGSCLDIVEQWRS